MKSNKRLGRGLNALIPDQSQNDGAPKARDVQEIDIASIEVNPFQPRIFHNQVAFQELMDSIKENGILQPILVSPVGNGRYRIIAGERRFRAATELGLKHVPVFIKDVETKEDMLELALIENVQREHLNPIDLARGYQSLIEECKLTQEEVAKKIGKDRATIANIIRLLKLPKEIQTSLQEGHIKEGHARALLATSNNKAQKDIWKKTVKNSLSVRRVEQLVKKHQKKLEGNESAQVEKKSRKSAFVTKMEGKLREKFGTQVKIRKRKETGTIEISFYSMEDFQRIMDIVDQIKF